MSEMIPSTSATGVNPFGLAHLWQQGDTVTALVALLLLVMSVSSWTVMLWKAWRLFRLRAMADRAAHFWHTTRFEDGLTTLLPATVDNPFLSLARRGDETARHHREQQGELHGVLNLSDWLSSNLRQAMDEATASLQSGLAILASVASTAPFVGLFGTVWGIYHALTAIGVSGQAGLDQVAGPVGESLIMTAFGLAVAIPAVLGYNALTRGNRAVVVRLNRFAHDLHAYLVTGGRVRKSASVAVMTAPSAVGRAG